MLRGVANALTPAQTDVKNMDSLKPVDPASQRVLEIGWVTQGQPEENQRRHLPVHISNLQVKYPTTL